MSNFSFGLFGKKKALNTPIPGEKHYGDRILISYRYDDENKKGYVLDWVMSGDNTIIENDCVNIKGYTMIINKTGKVVEGSSTQVDDSSESSLTTGENSSINTSTNTSTNTSQTDADDRTSESSIDSSERYSIDALHLGGRKKSRNRTRRRKSRKSSGKRSVSRRAKRAIIHHK